MEISKIVDRGCERAKAHGLTTERSICRYINLVVLFGINFDRDLPWAKAVLKENSDALPVFKIERLCAAAIHHLSSGDE